MRGRGGCRCARFGLRLGRLGLLREKSKDWCRGVAGGALGGVVEWAMQDNTVSRACVCFWVSLCGDEASEPRGVRVAGGMGGAEDPAA